jgi:hypothetical protein
MAAQFYFTVPIIQLLFMVVCKQKINGDESRAGGTCVSFPIFVIIVSFMLFTVFTLILYFFRRISDSRFMWIHDFEE